MDGARPLSANEPRRGFVGRRPLGRTTTETEIAISIRLCATLPISAALRFQRALQFIPRTLDLAEHVMITRVDPLLAARHALVARGQHLTRVLLPDPESIEFFLARESVIINQFVRRRVVRLRMFDFIEL